MIEVLRRHRRATVALVCGAATVAGASWIGHGDPLGNPAFLLVLEAIPLTVLVVAGTNLPWWLGVSAAVGMAAFTAASVESVQAGTSSTAVVVLPFIPLVLVAAVPCLVSACDVVALVRLRIRGGRIAPPRRGELVLAGALAAAGFLALLVFGLFAGLLTAVAVWAHRVRGEARPAQDRGQTPNGSATNL